MLALMFDIVATLCAVYVGWHFREEMHTQAYRVLPLTAAAIRPRIMRADALAAGLVLLIMGGIWL